MLCKQDSGMYVFHVHNLNLFLWGVLIGHKTPFWQIMKLNPSDNRHFPITILTEGFLKNYCWLASLYQSTISFRGQQTESFHFWELSEHDMKCHWYHLIYVLIDGSPEAKMFNVMYKLYTSQHRQRVRINATFFKIYYRNGRNKAWYICKALGMFFICKNRKFD